MFLCFTGTLAPIENEALFKPFTSLKVFTIIANNFREFMHSTNNKWLTSLNSNVNINPARWCSGDQNTVLELRDSRLNFFLVNQQDPYLIMSDN